MSQLMGDILYFSIRTHQPQISVSEHIYLFRKSALLNIYIGSHQNTQLDHNDYIEHIVYLNFIKNGTN
jgi:hypothetical protein